MNSNDHLEELKAALDEAAETIEVVAVLPPAVTRARVIRYRALASTRAALVDSQPHKQQSYARYIGQLEAFVQKVIADGGPRADEAALIISRENLMVLGLAEDKPVTGKFTRVSIKNTGLEVPCTFPGTNGIHKVYADGRRHYCRECGAEGTK